MSLLDISAILICLTAVFGVINEFFLKLPSAIGLLVISLVTSLSLIGMHAVFPDIEIYSALHQGVVSLDFSEAVLRGMLGFILFAGAMQVDFESLRSERWSVALMATVGVLISTVAVGAAFHYMVGMPFIIALLFGALISPTDPVAVLGLLKRTRVPRSLESKLAGESLFNDGIGYVVFLMVSAAAFNDMALTPSDAVVFGRLFVVEVGGGVALGALFGWLTYKIMQRIDDYALEVLLTLALVLGGSAMAAVLHVSGPIAMVIAGLLIGHSGRKYGMSKTTREHVDAFWRLIDEILNAILFLLIGLEVFAVAFNMRYLMIGLAAIPLVLATRLFVVTLLVGSLRLGGPLSRCVIPLMTWSGLRGAISVALVLSLPAHPQKMLLLNVTYVVVIFSIVVQGLTVQKLANWCLPRTED